MSQEIALQFIQQVSENKKLLERLRAAKDVVEVLEIAKESGFNLTAETLKMAATLVAQGVTSDELSEQDLEMVAGGGQTFSSDMQNAGSEILNLFGAS
jgi:predicted ribosomally synthesized peptide with nif11-like leader